MHFAIVHGQNRDEEASEIIFEALRAQNVGTKIITDKEFIKNNGAKKFQLEGRR